MEILQFLTILVNKYLLQKRTIGIRINSLKINQIVKFLIVLPFAIYFVIFAWFCEYEFLKFSRTNNFTSVVFSSCIDKIF